MSSAEQVEVLKGLLERVSALTATNRDADAAIMAALYLREDRHIGEEADDGPHGEWVKVKSPVWVDPRTGRWVCSHAFEFTSALRDAERLVGWLPGGWQISMMTPDPTRFGHNARAWAKVQPYHANDEGWKIGARDATGASLPIALTTAALMALLSAESAPVPQSHIKSEGAGDAS